MRDIPLQRAKTVLGLTVIAHENTFKKISGMETYQRLDIKVDKDVNKKILEDKLSVITKRVSRGTCVSLEEEIKNNEQQKRNIKVLGYILVGVIVLIGLINVVNTISTNLILRIREFGILRAVGISNARIKKVIMLEGLFYGLISGSLGCIIGNIFVYILFILMKQEMNLIWIFPWKATISAFVGSIVIGILSTIVPLNRISSMNIIDSVRIIE